LEKLYKKYALELTPIGRTTNIQTIAAYRKDKKLFEISISVEDKFLTEKEWKKSEKIVKKQRSQKKFTLYSKAEEAKKHSQRLTITR